jgi:hypothetical protein
VNSIIKGAQVYFYDENGDAIGDNEHFTAVLGGIQKEIYPGFNYFTSYLPTNKKFLTWQPVSKKVAEEQQEFLFWLHYKESSALHLWVEIHFDDDTKFNYQLFTYLNPKIGEVFMMPAGYVQLALATKNPSKNPACYQLYLRDNTGEISERRQYILDNSYNHYTRYFLFHNSLGGFDTLRTTGKASLSMAIEKEVSQKIINHNYDVEEGELFISDVSYNDEYEVSTGFISQTYLSYLKDMLISKAVFMVENGERIPIIIDARSVKLYEEGDSVFYLRFKFRIGYSNRVLTTILNDSLKPCPVVEREKAWRVKASSAYCITEII